MSDLTMAALIETWVRQLERITTALDGQLPPDMARTPCHWWKWAHALHPWPIPDDKYGARWLAEERKRGRADVEWSPPSELYQKGYEWDGNEVLALEPLRKLASDLRYAARVLKGD